jgi:hypothetical protein
VDLENAEIVAWADSMDGRWAIVETDELVAVECTDCGEEHLADVLLVDRKTETIMPFDSVQAARDYVTSMGLRVGWNT